MLKVAWILTALVCVPALTGCQSLTSMRTALDDRDSEIRDLRAERAKLKERNLGLAKERDTLEGQLRDARSAATQVVPAAFREERQANFPELDEVGVSYGMRDGEMVITLPSKISFGSGRAELSDEGKRALDAVVQRLNGEFATSTYRIEGHTDSDPIQRSGFESNRDLSLKRAMAVLKYLVETSNLADDRFVVVGHGQYSPVASNDSPESKARNRRVEIIVEG